ncbi:hypothetical protein NDA12_003983 [Ustilago hordei]|nr:hypothetical protein NDA15_005245 [Ustilago hordei]KAJ1580660.1 hypothetical protein NDA12_003983 [Ustilago hordei]
MIPLISTVTSALPSRGLPAWDQYTIASASLAGLVLIVLFFLLVSPSSASSPSSAPIPYSRLSTVEDCETYASEEDQGKFQLDDYPSHLRSALGTPLDAQSYEARRLYTHVSLAILSVVGLAIDAAAIVQHLLNTTDAGLHSKVYLSSSSAALRTLVVVLAMLDLGGLSESTRLIHVSLLTFLWLMAQLMVALINVKLDLPSKGADSNPALHSIGLFSTLFSFLLAFLTPTGPAVEVEMDGVRTVVRNSQGGGSVAESVFGFLALPVVRQAYRQGTISQDNIPALDHSYRSAVLAEEMIGTYRRILSSSLSNHPAGEARSARVKGQALLWALIKCNSAELKSTGVVLVIATFSFYVPKLGLSVLLGGMQDYDRTQQNRDTEDNVGNRARATLVYSAVFYLSLLWESLVIYYYFRPLAVNQKARVQIQLTTLLAWKRLRQKEAYSSTSSTTEAGKGEAVSSSSQVINLITTDVNRIFGRIDMFSFAIMGPLEVFVGGYGAYYLLGNGALVGLLVAALMQPIAILIGRVTEKIDTNLQASRDTRVSLLSEAIRAIRLIKYNAYEDSIAAQIMRSRRAELKGQAQKWTLFTFFAGFFALVPMLTIAVAFGWYTLVEGKELTAAVAFPAVAVLVELRFAVSYLPSNFLTLIQGWVSLKRIATFMETAEVKEMLNDYKPSFGRGSKEQGRIEVRDAEIAWPVEGDRTDGDGDGVFTLSISNAVFETGAINLVCGKTGSGKTLLLLSLLGEAQLNAGSIVCPRSHPAASLYASRMSLKNWYIDPTLTAYAPQRPFLFNSSLRDNILFGLPLNASRYRAVLLACGLKPDLKILKHGDQTELGEGGTNLSGGQKARISLARAVYSHAGTLLIDDCLSALDSHTTKHICEELFGDRKAGLLEARTTVLVTHHVRLMVARCNKVLVLQEGKQVFCGGTAEFVDSRYYEGLENEVKDSAQDGEQEDDGTPNFGSTSSTAASSANNSDDDAVEGEGLLEAAVAASVAGKNASAFSQRTIKRRPSSSAFSNVSGIVDPNAAPAQGGDGDEGETFKQVTEEKRAQGRVSFAVYNRYIGAGGGILLWIALVAAFCSNAFSDLGANWWLHLWTQSSVSHQSDHSTEWWFYRWVLIQSLQVIAITLGYALVCIASLLAGARLFSQLLRTVLRAPLRFHDCTPSGRLLNRFGKDMEAIDSNIAEELSEAAKSLLMAVAALVATYLGGGPIIIAILLIMSPLFYMLVSTFTIAARDLKRLDSNAASKRITCFTDLITGVVTIRAFGAGSAYFATLMERLDENMMFYFWQATVRQWQSLLLGLGSSGFVIASVLVVTLTPGFTAAQAGFTLSFVQNLTSMLQFGLRAVSNVEQSFVAVERVMEYFDVEIEPLDSAPKAVVERGEQIEPRASWPEKGAIEIKDLHLAYAEKLPDVLNGISLSIKPGERVGIVGATGSGKSTLVSALFRFFEYRSGQIIIDGVDIAKVGLKTLRSRMKIVPQDPLILSGTLRSAVDAMGEYNDQDITRVLVRVGLLKDKLTSGSPSAGYGTLETTSTPNVASRGGSTDSSTLLSRSSSAPGEGNDESGSLSSLESRIEESGSNLSSGQKQLVSLCRILLSASSAEKANSIVVLDESTSSIDYTTDAKMQTLLDWHFAAHNTTVLAIAHRLRSIIHFDTVVVLNRGKVVEKGNPVELLANEHGWFTRLAKSTGEQEYASLKRAIAL